MLYRGWIDFVLCFFLYSVGGWICECIYCSVPAKRFINRGFLNGPYCPVYGTGAVMMMLVVGPLYNNPVLLVLISIIVTTAVEYITGWLLETIFDMKWWDYSGKKIQFQGRICLVNSLLFGLLSFVLVYFIHPAVEKVFMHIPEEAKYLLAAVLTVSWVVDLLFTLNSISKLKGWLKKAQHFLDELKQHDRLYEWFERKENQGSLPSLREFLKAQEHKLKEPALIRQLEHLMERRKHGTRLMHAFPDLKLKGMDKAAKIFRDNWKWKRK